MNIILFDSLEEANEFSTNDNRIKHILTVLKLKVGDQFKCGIKNGSSGMGRITSITSTSVKFTYNITNKCPNAPLNVSIIVGAVRPICLKRMLRSASECGVKEVIVAGTDLGEKSYLESGFIKNREAEETIIDGATQSGNTYITKLSIKKSIDDAVSSIKNSKVFKIVLDNKTEFYKRDVPNLSEDTIRNREVVLLIGSERGFTDRERSIIQHSEFIPYKIGDRILRSETAFITALFPFIVNKSNSIR